MLRRITIRHARIVHASNIVGMPPVVGLYCPCAELGRPLALCDYDHRPYNYYVILLTLVRVFEVFFLHVGYI